MRNALVVMFVLICFGLMSTPAHAAKPGKVVKATKERLVLMPLRVGEDERSMLASMETSLVQGLQQNYEVFSGEQVAQKAKEIFNKESHSAKKDCDETRCMQGIAEAFQAELIATANVTRITGGYLLALSIQNIFDNKVVYSNSLPCKNCDPFQLVDKLKELSGSSVQASPSVASSNIEPSVVPGGNPNDPENSLWAEVQKGNSVDDYGAYLAQYPKGKYVALAKSRLNKLKEQEAAETRKQKDQAATELAQQEQSAWGNASSIATETSYSEYLKSYPHGRYAALATARIAKLKKEGEHGVSNLMDQNVKQGVQKRVALVIGNSDYKSQEVPKLAHPVNDARAMAAVLSKLGFNVIEVINATQKEMNRAIANFGTDLGLNTEALFYYAGYGLQVNGKNYLFPVDADISDEASVLAETVGMDTVLDQLNSSKVSIVILDACRNNPFKKTRGLWGGGLAQLEAPFRSYIAYATAPGHFTVEGGGKNGIYTQEIVKNISTPGITLEEVFKRVRVNVAKTTSDEQIPWDSSSLTESFYFSGAPSVFNERALWERIKNGSSIADFQTYLSQYPNGTFVKEAQKAKAEIEIELNREEEERGRERARLK